MDRMLINATQAEEVRVALVKNDILHDLDVEKPGSEKKKANIYKGKVTRVEPSLEAAFVEYGAKRQGFLPKKEVVAAFYEQANLSPESNPDLRKILREGQEIMVQVVKDERGTKGAALTTDITLAGGLLVLMPKNADAGGISRRIEGEQRDQLRQALSQLVIPQDMSVIIRTAGMGKQIEDLQWDLEVLLNQWQAINNVFEKQPAPFLIHQEGDVIIRSIRDNLRRNVEEIIIDTTEIFAKAKNYLEQIKPDYLNRVKLYQDAVPLFNRYNVEKQIETAYQREVLLPSGGSLVIDRTEALVAIDINSAKATGGGDIEETAYNTNLEAADEIARQLRLRDLGGLVVIDFIDMSPARNQREVENRLRDALQNDRARVQIGKISRFGLLEMSRQRLRLSLGESSQELCHQCQGRGLLRSIESQSLSTIRLIEDEAIKTNINRVYVQLPLNTATYLMNEKRNDVASIEKRHATDIIIIPNTHLEYSEYKIEGVKVESSAKARKPSYANTEVPQTTLPGRDNSVKASPRPAVQHITPTTRRPTRLVSMLKRIWQKLFGSSSAAKASDNNNKKKPQHNNQRRHHHNNQRRHHGGANRNRTNRSGHSTRRRPPGNNNNPRKKTDTTA